MPEYPYQQDAFVANEAPAPARPKWVTPVEPVEEWFTPGRSYFVSTWDGGMPVVADDDGDDMLMQPWAGAAAPQPSGSAAHAILTEAASIVQGVRNATHGPKERSFAVIANLWNAYLDGRKGGDPVTAFDVAQMMTLLKIARSIQGTPARDHFVDGAGYQGIAGELAA